MAGGAPSVTIGSTRVSLRSHSSTLFLGLRNFDGDRPDALTRRKDWLGFGLQDLWGKQTCGFIPLLDWKPVYISNEVMTFLDAVI